MLATGSHLGPYEITGLIGQGGMGQVYKARDTRLNRIVALKVSHEQFTERFQTEARAIAALEHPHICRLYDISRERDLSFLVMEYVEGAPLTGPLPLDRVLAYAGQIAGALDEAHSKGIVHRDLKPSNVLVTARGGIKLLDFGLARLGRDGDAPLDDAALTRGITAAGTILGTLHYMSPEQLQGAVADARSDIFSFGLVLYEMLTGRRAFEGTSAASVIAAILERPAPSVAEVAPAALDRLLKRCLAKDPDERWQSARDVKAALELVTEAPAGTYTESSAAPASANRWPWLLASGLAAALVGLAFVHFRETPPPDAPLVRVEIPTPAGSRMVSAPFLSPDGRTIAFVTIDDADGTRSIWVRRLDSLDARLLPGTELANNELFWSPDSQFIAFVADGKLKKVDVSGARPQTLADVSTAIGGGSWAADGTIVFSEFAGGLYRVPDTGGVPARLTTPEPGTVHVLPQLLPDGRHLIYTVGLGGSGGESQGRLYMASLDGSEQRPLSIEARGRIVYLPPNEGGRLGHVVFEQDGTLVAQPVDVSSFVAAGEVVSLADVGEQGTLQFGAPGRYSVSTRNLAYSATSTSSATQLTWFDREGRQLRVIGAPARYNDLSLSPDGAQLAVTRREGSNDDIWLVDLARNSFTRFTFEPGQDWHPVWSPDGSRLAFSSTRMAGGLTNSLFWKNTSGVGEEESILEVSGNQRLNDWSPDGRYLLFLQTRVGRTGSSPNDDLWLLPIEGDQPAGERKALAYLDSPFAETRGQFYPVIRTDGRQFVAYSSNESGRSEIYVESLPRGARRVTVSTGGGMQPRWRRDGRELYYMSLDRVLMAVAVRARGSTLEFGEPRELFRTRTSIGAAGSVAARVLRYDAAADGTRFIVNAEPESTDAAPSPITVVLNWTSLLNEK